MDTVSEQTSGAKEIRSVTVAGGERKNSGKQSEHTSMKEGNISDNVRIKPTYVYASNLNARKKTAFNFSP